MLDKLRTLFRLGPMNLGRVAFYRVRCRVGDYRRQLPLEQWDGGDFFGFPGDETSVVALPKASWGKLGDRVLGGELPIYSSGWKQVGFPPDWQMNATSGIRAGAAGIHWSDFNEFRLPGGDVKGYWESSRFDGLLILAMAWLESRDQRFAEGVEGWLADWCRNNPPNAGLNWKCAQEAGLRLMQTLLAATLLDRAAQVRPMAGLRDFVVSHCRRIEPTMLYAVAQDNNHGTSEAAALFVAGLWLNRFFPEQKSARRWCALGRKWLENRVARLVMPDGSFSQHSVNYHRLMLDTLWMAEYSRVQFGGECFSKRFYARARAATDWLEAMVDPSSGDAPNLGANDGARLFVLHGLPYRDFRPSVQMASVLFRQRRAYARGPWDEPLMWLGLDGQMPSPAESTSESRVFPDGGYTKLISGDVWLLLRLPKYRFRPSHADALHVDLWHRGVNVLRDGGTYSYNTDAESLAYFPGTKSHNTVELDGRDQMPRLGRFLFGHWLSCKDFKFDATQNVVCASYRDFQGGEHRREVHLATRFMTVTDHVKGVRDRAVLRWRLAPGAWRVLADGRSVEGPFGRLKVDSSVSIVRSELVEGWESRHYGEKTSLPVWEVEIREPGRVVTTVTLH